LFGWNNSWFMSFKLAMKGRAEFGKDSEVRLKAGGSLSIVHNGRVILAASFAFLWCT